jgi:ferritin-like metal-binding protein YciE
MAKLNSLKDLFIEELKDLYNAEQQLTQALPAMAKAASSEELKTAFIDHLDETKVHIERLEKIFEELGESPKGKKCKAMEGLVAEGKDMIKEDAEAAVKDAGLIAAAQRVEHYEMAGYGCVRTFAALLGYADAAELLQTTLDEEGAADERLTDIAEELNIEAESAESDSSPETDAILLRGRGSRRPCFCEPVCRKTGRVPDGGLPVRHGKL